MRSAFNFFSSVILILFLGSFFHACKEDLDLEPLPPVQVDSNLPAIGSELFVEFSINGTARRFDNEYEGYSFGIDSAWYQRCTDTTFDRLKSQSFYVTRTADTPNVRFLNIEFLNCSDELTLELDFDSVLVPGTYGFGSVADTLQGAVITWVDNDRKVWKSTMDDTLPDPNIASIFTIQDVVRNYDGFARYYVAGTFEGILYDTSGNDMTISNGVFVSRMGREY